MSSYVVLKGCTSGTNGPGPGYIDPLALEVQYTLELAVGLDVVMIKRSRDKVQGSNDDINPLSKRVSSSRVLSVDCGGFDPEPYQQAFNAPSYVCRWASGVAT